MPTPLEACRHLHHIGFFETTRGKTHAADRILDTVGSRAYATPFSSWAPSCDGSPIALSDKLTSRQARVICSARMGPWALSHWPFNAGSATAARFSYVHSAPCILCTRGDVGSVEHLIRDCPHEHYVSWRPRLWSAAKHLLRRLVFLLGKAHRQLPIPEHFDQAADDVLAQLLTCPHFDPASRDHNYLLQRLLFCAPFSARDVREAIPMGGVAAASDAPRVRPRADMPLSAAVGALFDAVVLPRHHMRQAANVWTQWAFRNIMHLAGLYCCARPHATAPGHDTHNSKICPPPCPVCRTRDASRHRVGPFDWDDVSVGDASDDDEEDTDDDNGEGGDS